MLKKIWPILFALMAMAVFSIGLDLMKAQGERIRGSQVSTPPESTVPSVTAALAATDTIDSAEAGPDLPSMSLKVIEDNGFLRLVNGDHRTEQEDSEDLVRSSDGLYRYRKDIAEDLGAFFRYAREQDNGLYIASAYRTLKDQDKIYDRTKNKALVQKAGYSEHHTGLALDLQPTEALSGKYGDALKNEIQFMKENAWKFGFIQRYPEGKNDVTGIEAEYWHYRYVGEPHAQFMKEHDMVLEEYLDYLEANRNVEISTGTGKFRVTWCEPENSRIYFESGISYTVSSTNTGAYVVTVRTEG